MTSDHSHGETCAQPEVAAIILNYNGKELLEKYLPSVTRIEYEPYRIVVSDNGSTDGSVEFLREEYPEVEIVENEENLGFAGGNNAGAAAAPDADYLWFLNNDVRVTPSSLDTLIEHIESAPDVGIVVPRINHMDSEHLQSLGFLYNRFGYAAPRDAGRTTPSNETPHEVAYAMGSALLINREVWDAVGGFDGENFIYGDDEYLCFNAWLRGHHVEVVPDSVVYHERDASSGFFAYHDARNRLRAYLKTLQLRTIVTGFPLLCALNVAKSAKDVLVRRKPSLVGHRLAGVLAGLSTLPEVYRARRRIQQHREYDDERFLTPVKESLQEGIRLGSHSSQQFGGPPPDVPPGSTKDREE